MKEMETGASILWQGGRYFNRLTILKKKIGSMSVRLIKTLKYEDVERILVGFSEDKQTIYIKKSENGLKLSTASQKSKSKTFSASGLVSQFGDNIIGAYTLESISEEGIIELKRSEWI